MAHLSAEDRSKIIHETQRLLDTGASFRVDGATITRPNELLRAMIEDPECDANIAQLIAAQLHNIYSTIELAKLRTPPAIMSANIRIDLSGQAPYYVDFEFF